METVIELENISKQYRLGQIGTGTLSHDINRWWARVRGKQDPTLKIGQENKLNAVDGDYVWALKDINLEVKQGEVLGIIGKNGAGKSTLLKILSRVTGPTTGQIKVKGRIASLLEVGTGFHPELTGKENIYLNGAILGMTKAEITKKLDEIVDFAGVAKYLETPVKRYSSGMYVRLAFAVAAHLDPEILIVDEVLAVGDAEFQKKAIGKMQDISSGGGRTVLFVSHNMSVIRRICTKTLVLVNGKTFFEGSTESAIQTYSGICENKLKENSFLQYAKIIDEFGIDTSIIHNFTKYIVEIKFKEDFKIFCSDFKIELFLKNEFNETIATLSSWLNEQKFSVNECGKKMMCEIESIPISKGNYFFDLQLYCDFKFVYIEKILFFEVINIPEKSGHFYPLKEMHGAFMVKNIWIIN